MTHERLLTYAKEALANAYAPYSHFAVGAALLCADGTVYTGCNIENAAFSPTVCAERVAVFKAVSEGKRDFDAIAIVNGNGTPCSPCGVCRQVMSEFCAPDFTIVLEDKNGKPVPYSLAELLPHSFQL